MRYRRLDPTTGDMEFGNGLSSFGIDTPEAVAQAVRTRLGLWLRDWFLDATEGMDWRGKVLGVGTSGLYDIEIQERILGTEGVNSLLSYASQRNPDARSLDVQAMIDTIYGPAPLTLPALGLLPPPISDNVFFQTATVVFMTQRVIWHGAFRPTQDVIFIGQPLLFAGQNVVFGG